MLRAVVTLALLAVTARPLVHAAAPGGRVVGVVKLTEADGKPAAPSEVIVYITGFTEPPAGTTAKIEQKGRRFIPDLVAVTVGDKVEFPNRDPFLHNVFSQSPPRKFDLGSFKKGESKDRQFTNTGAVEVYCNIHPEMAATILVLPNRRHTRVGPDGKFAIDGVPPGTWTVFAYTRRAPKPASAKITVAAGADTTIDLSVVRGTEQPHANKYGEKYRPEPPTTYR
jgi:plastocyanin